MMKKYMFGILSGAMCSLACADGSPVGYWKTIDDVTHEPKALVQVYLEKNNTLSGKIIKLYRETSPAKRCEACKGDLHNQLISGLQIITGLRQQADHTWSQGSILDPKNGKTYKCLVTLKNNGSELQVRGYLGLPLFGRTQVWKRSES